MRKMEAPVSAIGNLEHSNSPPPGVDSSPEQASDSEEEESEKGYGQDYDPQELNAEMQIEGDFEHVLLFSRVDLQSHSFL